MKLKNGLAHPPQKIKTTDRLHPKPTPLFFCWALLWYCIKTIAMLFFGGELSSSLLNGSWTFPSRQTLDSVSLSAPLPRRVWAEAEVGGRANAKIQSLVRECVCFRPIVKPFLVSCQSNHAQSFQLLPALSQHFAWYLPEFLRISSSLLMWVILLYGTQYHWVCYSFSAAVCHWQRWWLSLCVATVSDEPPTQAWGSPHPMWFLWQQPNTPELLIPSGLWCNSQFYVVALFSVGWLDFSVPTLCV